MTRRLFLHLTCFINFYLVGLKTASAKNNESNLLVTTRPKSYPGHKEFRIVQPGKYFFSEDQIQHGSFLDSEGNTHKPVGGMMLSILCGNVEVDFRGHTLGADVKMGGISLSDSMNVRLAKRSSNRANSLNNRDVLLHNGTIDLARGWDTGDAIDFYNFWHGQRRRTVGRPDENDGKMIEVVYERNNYRFERLKVLAHGVALTAEGSHTVIRDCIIESSDLAAIFIAGNNTLIENCEIRLRKSRLRFSGPRAAIVLRDGSHAIIRNNVVRVDGGDDGEVYGILIRDAASNIVIENNTFINTRENAINLTDDSTAVIKNNKYEKKWIG